MLRSRDTRLTLCALLIVAEFLGWPLALSAQEPATREQAIEEQQREKAQRVTPQVPNRAERLTARAFQWTEGSRQKLHPFFQSAYMGGGFTLGAGYGRFVSPYNLIDFRGSYTLTGYKRIEAEFSAPHLMHRRARLSVLGGWREATQVGFYGLGTDHTSLDDRVDYSFQQPYLSTTLTVKPTRRFLTLIGGVEYSQWKQRPGQGGSAPSIETKYDPSTLPGLGASPSYFHTLGTVAFDWRTSPGYTRRGGFYGVTVHDYSDRDDRYGFRQLEYEAIQHVPILREAWVLSFRGFVRTTFARDGQVTPFFMLPEVGGGGTLRAFTSWRFRDNHAVVLQGEWRIMVNRFMDTAFFYDMGKVAARTSDLNLEGLKHNAGVGVRFHSPFTTPLRVEIASGNEGHAPRLRLVGCVLGCAI